MPSIHCCRATNSDEPTFFRTGARPDILDIAISKDIPWPLSLKSVSDLSSDYNPLLISFESEASSSEVGLRRTFDWTRFVVGRSVKIPFDTRDNVSLSL